MRIPQLCRIRKQQFDIINQVILSKFKIQLLVKKLIYYYAF